MPFSRKEQDAPSLQRLLANAEDFESECSFPSSSELREQKSKGARFSPWIIFHVGLIIVYSAFFVISLRPQHTLGGKPRLLLIPDS